MAPTRSLGLVALAALAGCIDHVSLANAPCPCGSGASCCESLGACLEPGQVCPVQYPRSSGLACKHDDECPANEACYAWSLGPTADGQAGPRQCRTRCQEDRCPDGESCRLSPTDGQPLRLHKLATLCVPKSATGCEGWSCDGCPGRTVGGAFCQGNDLHGCVLSAHPVCGLACKQVLLQACKSCSEAGGEAQCELDGTSSLCDLLPCGSCPPGSTECRDVAIISACFLAAYSGPTCKAICRAEPIATCGSGQSCVGQSGTATCLP
jgi:hypothetical protein